MVMNGCAWLCRPQLTTAFSPCSLPQSRVFQLPLMTDMAIEQAILAALPQDGSASSSSDKGTTSGSQGRGGGAISGQTEAGAVPLIDMANHSPGITPGDYE
jgi:hypothetical protein